MGRSEYNKYCYRYAQINDFDFNPPLNHPYNPLPALRLSLPGIAGDAQHQLISAIFEAGWSRGIDLASEADLANVLESLGLNSSEMLNACFIYKMNVPKCLLGTHNNHILV